MVAFSATRGKQDRPRSKHYLWQKSMCSDTPFHVGPNDKGPLTLYDEHVLKKGSSSSSSSGDGSAEVTVNWRFNWAVTLPCEHPRLRLQLFDKPADPRDVATLSDAERKARAATYAHGPDDHWAEATLDLSQLFRLAIRKGE